MKTNTNAAPVAHTPTHERLAIDWDPRTGDLTIETEYNPVSVARICHQDPQQDGGRSFDLERKYADLIVRAANSHADLLAIVEDKEAELECDFRNAESPSQERRASDQLEQIRAVLAKARGAQFKAKAADANAELRTAARAVDAKALEILASMANADQCPLARSLVQPLLNLRAAIAKAEGRA